MRLLWQLGHAFEEQWFQRNDSGGPRHGGVRHKYGVPDSLASCHTAIVDGYTIEGHVPAADIQRLLKERPKAKGLAVPGMPVGSPGMEGARSQPYSVMMFDANGKAVAYHSYSQK